MEIKSKALEVNIADYHVDVDVDPKYSVIQNVMSKYFGLMEGLNIFLKELSHPYRNWQFIIQEARGYTLDYFHLLKNHSQGPDAATSFVEIFISAIDNNTDKTVKADAIDNLLLYLQKIITDSDSVLTTFFPALNTAFERIFNFDDETFFLFIKSYYQLNKLAESILNQNQHPPTGYQTLNRLLLKYYRKGYDYWIGEGDPLSWFTDETGKISDPNRIYPLFTPISLNRIQTYIEKIETIAKTSPLAKWETLESLLTFPGYNQIVDTYRRLPRGLFQAGANPQEGNRWKIIFLFRIMNISGLSMIHEETLRDVNRTLSWLIDHEKHYNIGMLIDKTFSIIQEKAAQFPDTALHCVLNMGKGVYKTDDIDLINPFIDAVIDLGFQTPKVSGVGNDWQIRANTTHIQNIRTWIELIELNPNRSIRLLSALIIHLSLSGIFIKDTDLFPRDITRFLNQDIGTVYNLVKQLTRLFPAFFNDIGAEGQLRDISTKIDELTHRKDVLIHFLRKQSHVESSNLIIGFIESALYFWETKDKQRLVSMVPPNIFSQIDESGPFIDGVHQVLTYLKKRGMSLPHDLITVNEEQLADFLVDIPDVTEIDLERVKLAVSFYKLLHQKYNIDFIEMERYLEQVKSETLPNVELVRDALSETDLLKKLTKLLEYLEQLKALILSPSQYEVREDIYQKRHFTVDIPSMYGSYHEAKFDAMGLAFRIESLVNVLFEEAIEDIDLSLITKATFDAVYNRLVLFNRALKLDGVTSPEFEDQLDFLIHSIQVRGFTFTQYLDIFKRFAQSVKNIINDYFNNIHEKNLNKILSRKSLDQLLPKYLPPFGNIDDKNWELRVSEIFFRDRIAMSLGLQQLDLFLSRILNTIYLQSDKLHKSKLHQLLLYDPQKIITAIDQTDDTMFSAIYLGNKGRNLVQLNRLGFPVPPGFIITSEVFRYREVIFSYPAAEQNFKEQVVRQITGLQRITGKILGAPRNPLLLSVRSGSALSQPGMMDTFLNVGMNENIAIGLAAKTGKQWFAWDNYRRFLQTFGMAHGLERDDFDGIINDFKQKFSKPYKREFSGEEMKKTALAYKTYIQDSGFEIVEDPLEQLYWTIRNVFASWESTKAKIYRDIMGISDDWGTAVTVQAMVFGNISTESGSGVLFTHNPRWSGDTLRMWGDFTIGNQGEDVVSGLVNTLPISFFQQEFEKRETDQMLETVFPDIYGALKEWANELIYREGWSPQELEFTFESPSRKELYLLQTRDMAMRELKKVMTFALETITDDRMLGHGIGVSGGAMSGRVVFTLEEIDKWRNLEPDTSLILVRGDTVPDDIKEIFAADGLLTARGGVTSHASVVAHNLEKTCVVGCGNLICNEREKNCLFNRILVTSGDFISIDGQSGSIYQGFIRVNEI